jgi:thiol-disulfide isomerase/thioredoxin
MTHTPATHWFFIIPVFFITTLTQAQPVYNNKKATQVLKATLVKLQALKTVQYQYQREIHYYTENYHNSMAANLYIDFTVAGSQTGFRFQASDDGSATYYNGAHYFHLNSKAKTIDLQVKTSTNLLESTSYLFNSLLTIRNALPLIIQNDSIQKTLSDTLIDNTTYDLVRFEMPSRYFSSLGNVNTYTAANLRRPYQLIIDRKTSLPFQFIARFRRGDDEGDLIKAIFTQIDTHPVAPTDLSWFYSSYTTAYAPAVAKKEKPLIAKGALVANWSLPSWTPTKLDSVSVDQYKGKVVLLDFWIKSCGYCMQAFPHMNALQQRFGTDKFQLLAINAEDPVEDIAFFYKKHQPLYKMLFKGEALAKNYGVSAFPMTVLLDETGKVIYAGVFDHVVLEELIKVATDGIAKY